MAQLRRPVLPAVAVACGALALLALALPGADFVAPATAPGKLAATTSPDLRGTRLPRAADKTLFEKTKNLNSKIQEANSENVVLMDTDGLWAIGYVVAGLLSTWLFISVLYSLKPES
mmetsp:Transcript_61967/g.176012  ORF Transcript_61967/g.176012 Transcript_61967/m.176012 type:complete len:117 (+) Transcript_61967:83-433(+)